MKFSELSISKLLFKGVQELNFPECTSIQEQSFSPVMSGANVLGIAQTGTGKTLAYLLPMMNLWKFSKEKHPTMLVLVPTRELVQQVEEEARKLAKYTSMRIGGVFGGANINTQRAMVEEGLDLLIATPGRLIDFIDSGNVRLKNIKRLVIDEMDQLMGTGFRPQLIRILDSLPEKRQTLLFSATHTDEVSEFISQYVDQVLKIEATAAGSVSDNIHQFGYEVPNFYTKLNLLTLLLNEHPEMKKVLVFVSSIKLADEVYRDLENSFTTEVGVIHSNRAQTTRFNLVDKFNSGTIRVLVATDIVARGIDIEEVSHVINFDVPDEPEDYVHRIGRTGRASHRGISISFISNEEVKNEIEAFTHSQIELLSLPKSLTISDLEHPDDKPKIRMKNPEVTNFISGPAFHEKKAKNLKVNTHLTRDQQHKLKYGKPKTRGDKFRKK